MRETERAQIATSFASNGAAFTAPVLPPRDVVSPQPCGELSGRMCGGIEPGRKARRRELAAASPSSNRERAARIWARLK